MGLFQRRFVRVAAGPVAGCHRLRRCGPCTPARTMSPFKWIHSLVIAAAASVADMGGVTSAQASVVFDLNENRLLTFLDSSTKGVVESLA